MRRMFVRGLVLTTLAAALVWARQNNPGGHTPPSPDQMASHMVSWLTTMLNLTSDQQTQASAIFTTEATSQSSVRPQIQAARKALRTAVQSNDTAGITSAATQIGTLTGQEAEAQGKAEAAFYAILTSDQKTKYEQLHAGGPGGPGGFGGPGPGHGGPPPPMQ